MDKNSFIEARVNWNLINNSLSSTITVGGSKNTVAANASNTVLRTESVQANVNLTKTVGNSLEINPQLSIGHCRAKFDSCGNNTSIRGVNVAADKSTVTLTGFTTVMSSNKNSPLVASGSISTATPQVSTSLHGKDGARFSIS